MPPKALQKAAKLKKLTLSELEQGLAMLSCRRKPRCSTASLDMDQATVKSLSKNASGMFAAGSVTKSEAHIAVSQQ